MVEKKRKTNFVSFSTPILYLFFKVKLKNSQEKLTHTHKKYLGRM